MAPIVDANVFMRGRRRPFDSAVTVPEVVEELESQESQLNFDLEDVSVKEPEQRHLEKVKNKSEEINSPTSETDERLAALALQLEQKLITDDKALQNLALHLGIEFESFLTDEIDGKRRWKMVCENCGSEVEGDKCSVCGSTSILRKPC